MKTFKLVLHNVEFTFYIDENYNYDNLNISPPHIHALPELFIVLDGNAEVRCESISKKVTNKEICIIPECTFHDIINNSNYTRLAIKFSIKRLHNNCDIDIFSYFVSILTSDSPFVTGFNSILIKEIFDCLKSNYVFKDEKLKGILLLILIEIAEKLHEKEVPKQNYFEKNYNKNLWLAENDILLYQYSIGEISIKELSDTIFITPRQLTRIVLSEFGLNLLNLKSETRMRRAKFYLRETNMSIGEISNKLHFSSKESFIICFKKHYGITPLKARKNGSK